MIRTSFHKDLTGTTFGITWMQFEKLFLEFQTVELHFNHWWCFISLSDRLFLLPCFPTFMITYDRKCQTAKAGLETWNPAMKQFLMIQPWSYSMPYFVTMKLTIRYVLTKKKKKHDCKWSKSFLQNYLYFRSMYIVYSHCLLSCSMDLFSSSSRALTAFTIEAWNSSAPLRDTHRVKWINILKTVAFLILK